jgi:hypothetical protein
LWSVLAAILKIIRVGPEIKKFGHFWMDTYQGQSKDDENEVIGRSVQGE